MLVVHDDVIDVSGKKRNEGAGEIDPEPLERAMLHRYGAEALVEREGCLLLEAATIRRPHPKFLLRARIKQLFSYSFTAGEKLSLVVHDDAVGVR